MNFANVKAVIFDFDGTLYDYKGVAKNLLKQLDLRGILYAGKERALRKRYKGKYFSSAEEFYREFFADLAKACRSASGKIENWYNQKYMKAMTDSLKKNYSCRNGAKELFSHLRNRGIKTAVFSDYAKISERMRAVGFEENTADFLFSAETLGGLKPAVQPFLKIAEVLQTEPPNILVVGDRSDTDGKGAISAGMQFVQIKTHKTGKNENAIEWNEFVKLVFEFR